MTTKVTVNGNDYTIVDDTPFDESGSFLITDALGQRVGVLHDDAAVLITVPAEEDFMTWQNPDPGPKGLLLLRIRDAWKATNTKKALVTSLHDAKAPDVASLLQTADTLAAAKVVVATADPVSDVVPVVLAQP